MMLDHGHVFFMLTQSLASPPEKAFWVVFFLLDYELAQKTSSVANKSFWYLLFFVHQDNHRWTPVFDIRSEKRNRLRWKANVRLRYLQLYTPHISLKIDQSISCEVKVGKVSN